MAAVVPTPRAAVAAEEAGRAVQAEARLPYAVKTAKARAARGVARKEPAAQAGGAKRPASAQMMVRARGSSQAVKSASAAAAQRMAAQRAVVPAWEEVGAAAPSRQQGAALVSEPMCALCLSTVERSEQPGRAGFRSPSCSHC